MAQRTTRRKYKRKLSQCKDLITNVQLYLAQFSNEYENDNPELAIQAVTVSSALDEINKALQKLHDNF